MVHDDALALVLLVLLRELLSEPGAARLVLADVVVIPVHEAGVERRALRLGPRLTDAALVDEVGQEILVAAVQLGGSVTSLGGLRPCFW